MNDNTIKINTKVYQTSNLIPVQMSPAFTQTLINSDYNNLTNKPQINSNELVGDKSGPQLGLQNKMNVLSQTEIEKILYLG